MYFMKKFLRFRSLFSQSYRLQKLILQINQSFWGNSNEANTYVNCKKSLKIILTFMHNNYNNAKD